MRNNIRLRERMDGKKKAGRKGTGTRQTKKMKEKIGLDASVTNGRKVCRNTEARLAGLRGSSQKNQSRNDQRAEFIMKGA